MIMCVLLCYPVSIRIYYQQDGLFLVVCCVPTDCGSLFHSVGEAIAKSHLPMAFLGQTEERDSQFPRVRLLNSFIEKKLKEIIKITPFWMECSGMSSMYYKLLFLALPD